MPSFSSVDFSGGSTDDAVNARQPEIITDVLKGDMGFDGFVITDWQGIRQLPGTLRRPGGHRGQRGHRHVHGAYSGSRTGYRSSSHTLTGLVGDGNFRDRIDDAGLRGS